MGESITDYDELESVHSCKESEDKIVCISVDMFGNTSCVYCGRQVDYRPYYSNLYKKDILKIINDLKEEQNGRQKRRRKERKS